MVRRLNDQQRELVTKHLDFALWVSRSTVARFPNEVEEIHAVARLELVESAARFDPSLGFRFTTYADRRIRWKLHEWVTTQRRNDSVGLRADDESDPLGLVPDPAADHQVVDVIRSLCTPRQADVLVLLVVEGLSTRGAANRLGVRQQTVEVLAGRAKRRVQEKLGFHPEPTDTPEKNSGGRRRAS
jgi:RNA polymerase sigma factor (sigma-70 family)